MHEADGADVLPVAVETDGRAPVGQLVAPALHDSGGLVVRRIVGDQDFTTLLVALERARQPGKLLVEQLCPVVGG